MTDLMERSLNFSNTACTRTTRARLTWLYRATAGRGLLCERQYCVCMLLLACFTCTVHEMYVCSKVIEAVLRERCARYELLFDSVSTVT
jgi:hypothetical protein